MDLIRGKVAVVAVACLSLQACAGYGYAERAQRDDIPPGPGLFTGEQGAFILYDGDREAVAAASSESATDGGATPAARDSATPPEIATDPEYEEFRQYQEWKEYQEFRKWKEMQQKKSPQ